jgi:hypothetical protein
MPLPRSGLKAKVTRRALAGAAPLPKVYLAAGVATMSAMMYALLREDGGAREKTASTELSRRKQHDADVPMSDAAGSSSDAFATAAAAASTSSASATIRTLDGQNVSADNVPKFMLANSGLDNEQKLQVALCRRQAWLRAAQLAPTLALWSYAACVLTEHSGLARLPRGSRTAVPLGAAVVGGVLGSYYGGLEGKPMMNAALIARPVEHAHKRRSERPKEVCSDALERADTDAPAALLVFSRASRSPCVQPRQPLSLCSAAPAALLVFSRASRSPCVQPRCSAVALCGALPAADAALRC